LANLQSAFVAAVIRDESLVPVLKDKRHIDELITFATLNRVKGAAQYQTQYIDTRSGHLQVQNWRIIPNNCSNKSRLRISKHPNRFFKQIKRHQLILNKPIVTI
jgi:hypothetical protein